VLCRNDTRVGFGQGRVTVFVWGLFAPAYVEELIFQLCVDWFLTLDFIYFSFILFFMSVFCVLRVRSSR